jgi:predicted AAA+ superfamily ATPase
MVINQIAALNDYLEKDNNLYFWRTRTGSEVDLLLSRGPGDTPTAIKIKSDSNPEPGSLRGLLSFRNEYPEAKLYCLCNTTADFIKDGIRFVNWRSGVREALERRST